MNPALSHYRHERKFLPWGVSLNEVLALLRRHPAGFREAFPPRVVNNIYLDTTSLRDFRLHVEGISRRAKTRVRWYGLPAREIPCPTLERKLKAGSVSAKQSFPLPALHPNGAAPRDVLRRAVEAAELPANVRAELLYLHPTLANCYQRYYFVSADGQVRLTLDFDLQFGPPDRFDCRFTTSPGGAPRLVIEVKYAPEVSDRAAAITSRLPFRLARCSKYVLGLEHLGCR